MGWERVNWFAHSAAEHAAAPSEVALFDQTSFAKIAVRGSDAVLSVMGPRSRALLSDLSSSDFSASAFPFGQSLVVDLRGLAVRATRLTYVGELGWELYVPSEMAVAAFERLGPYISPASGSGPERYCAALTSPCAQAMTLVRSPRNRSFEYSTG